MTQNNKRGIGASSNQNKPKSIIDNTSPSIVVKETPIQLSDEKMKRILSQTYESAIKDANRPKYYKLYGVLLSVSLSLLISLTTSTAKTIGSISAEMITIAMWIICVSSGLTGIVFLLIASNSKMKNDTDRRDSTIDTIFQNHFEK